MRVVLSVATAGAAIALVACGPSSKSDGCQDNILSGDLVITEVFADYKAPPGGAGTDEGKEWVEIYNAGDRPIDLEGMTIVHSRPDGSREKIHVMEPVTIAPEQYLTLGNSVADLLPAYIDYGYSADLGDFFNSDGGKLALRCGDAEVDSAVYDGINEGRSRQLTASQPPDYTLNDTQENWCEANASEFDAGNFGTPGSESDCTPVIVGQCSDGSGMRDTIAPAAGDLVITEIMPNPIGSGDVDTAKEWFEVKVLADVDLNGIGIDRLDTTTSPDVIESPDCIRVTAGSYVVFARNADPAMNGELPSGAVLGTFSKTGLVQTAGDLQILSNGAVVDAVTWTGTREGKTISLDPDAADTTSNDDPSNFCDGSVAYNAENDLGTPGAENTQCVLLPGPGMCDDNGTIRSIRKPAAGTLVITEFLANPAGTTAGIDGKEEWFEITNAGSAAFDLNELGLKGNATTINIIQAATCKAVAPGGFALFAHTTDAVQNGGLPAVDATFAFALPQTNGSITVFDGATPLDVVTWASGIVDGAARQLDPTKTTATDNDDPANFCNAKAPQQYGTSPNFGTPKALNVCLP